jgi:hypothetical protein
LEVKLKLKIEIFGGMLCYKKVSNIEDINNIENIILTIELMIKNYKILYELKQDELYFKYIFNKITINQIEIEYNNNLQLSENISSFDERSEKTDELFDDFNIDDNNSNNSNNNNNNLNNNNNNNLNNNINTINNNNNNNNNNINIINNNRNRENINIIITNSIESKNIFLMMKKNKNKKKTKNENKNEMKKKNEKIFGGKLELILNRNDHVNEKIPIIMKHLINLLNNEKYLKSIHLFKDNHGYDFTKIKEKYNNNYSESELLKELENKDEIFLSNLLKTFIMELDDSILLSKNYDVLIDLSKNNIDLEKLIWIMKKIVLHSLPRNNFILLYTLVFYFNNIIIVNSYFNSFII